MKSLLLLLFTLISIVGFSQTQFEIETENAKRSLHELETKIASLSKNTGTISWLKNSKDIYACANSINNVLTYGYIAANKSQSIVNKTITAISSENFTALVQIKKDCESFKKSQKIKMKTAKKELKKLLICTREVVESYLNAEETIQLAFNIIEEAQNSLNSNNLSKLTELKVQCHEGLRQIGSSNNLKVQDDSSEEEIKTYRNIQKEVLLNIDRNSNTTRIVLNFIKPIYLCKGSNEVGATFGLGIGGEISASVSSCSATNGDKFEFYSADIGVGAVVGVFFNINPFIDLPHGELALPAGTFNYNSEITPDASIALAALVGGKLDIDFKKRNEDLGKREGSNFLVFKRNKASINFSVGVGLGIGATLGHDITYRKDSVDYTPLIDGIILSTPMRNLNSLD